MGGVEDRAARHAVDLRLFDQLFHHAIAGHHAHAVVGVHDHRGGRFENGLQLRHGQERAVFDAVEIDRLEAVAAVALDAAAVGFQEHVGADRRVLLRDAVGLEHLDHEAVHERPGNVGSGFHTLILPCGILIVFVPGKARGKTRHTTAFPSATSRS